MLISDVSSIQVDVTTIEGEMPLHCGRVRSDNPVALEAFELVGANSDRREHFGVMLAKLGRPSHRPAVFGRIGHLDRSAGDADWTPGGIFAVYKHPALSDFRIGDHFLDRAHRRARSRK